MNKLVGIALIGSPGSGTKSRWHTIEIIHEIAPRVLALRPFAANVPA
jgi:hypothetical protein